MDPYYNLFLFLGIKLLNQAHGQIEDVFGNDSLHMNYSTAVSYCNERGMRFPSTLSETEYKALMEQMNTSNIRKVWLSVRRVISEEWLSVDGSKVFFMSVGSISGIRLSTKNGTRNKRCLAIKKHSKEAVNCFAKVAGALCYKKECRMCQPWNCARLEEGCIWVIFNVPNWYTGRSECRALGGDLWTLSDAWEDSFSKVKVEQGKEDFWVGWRKDDWVIDTADTVLEYQIENHFEKDKGTDFSCAVIEFSDQITWSMYNCSLSAATVCHVNKSIDEGETEIGNSSYSSACQCKNNQCENPGSVMRTVILGCLCPLMIMLMTFGFYLCIRKRTRLREFTKRYRERLHQSRIMEQLYDTLTFSRDRSKSNTAKSSVEEMTKEMPVYAVVRKKSRKEEETPESGFHCTAFGVEDVTGGNEVRKCEEGEDSLVSERDKYGTYIDLEE